MPMGYQVGQEYGKNKMGRLVKRYVGMDLSD